MNPECVNSADQCDNSVITAAAKEVSDTRQSERGVYITKVSVCINADYTT